MLRNFPQFANIAREWLSWELNLGSRSQALSSPLLLLWLQCLLFFYWSVLQQPLTTLPKSYSSLTTAPQIASPSPASHCWETVLQKQHSQCSVPSSFQQPSRAVSWWGTWKSLSLPTFLLPLLWKCHPPNILQDNCLVHSTNCCQEKRVSGDTVSGLGPLLYHDSQMPVSTTFGSQLEQTNRLRHLWNCLGNLNIC